MMEGRRLADRFLILKTIGAGGATEVSLAQDAEPGSSPIRTSRASSTSTAAKTARSSAANT